MDVVLVVETESPLNQGGSCDLPGRVINPNGTETHETETAISDSERGPENIKKGGRKNSAEKEGVIHNPETRTINRGMKDIIGADSEVCHHILFLRSSTDDQWLEIP